MWKVEDRIRFSLLLLSFEVLSLPKTGAHILSLGLEMSKPHNYPIRILQGWCYNFVYNAWLVTWVLRSSWLHRKYSQSLSHFTSTSIIFLKLTNVLPFFFKIKHKSRNESIIQFCDYYDPHTHTCMHKRTHMHTYVLGERLLNKVHKKEATYI